MNSMRKTTLSILVVLLIAFYGCTIRYYDVNKLQNDYTTEGFLDRDHYQVIITGMPDKDAKGLVAQRESALKNAKINMDDKIISSIAGYNLSYHVNRLKIKASDIRNIADVKKYLAEKMRDFLKFGYIAFEYYNIDNSAVLVYRIFKEDLADKIESVKPEIGLNERR